MWFAGFRVLTSALLEEAICQLNALSIDSTVLLTVGGLRMVFSCNANGTWPDFVEVDISESCELT